MLHHLDQKLILPNIRILAAHDLLLSTNKEFNAIYHMKDIKQAIIYSKYIRKFQCLPIGETEKWRVQNNIYRMGETIVHLGDSYNSKIKLFQSDIKSTRLSLILLKLIVSNF